MQFQFGSEEVSRKSARWTNLTDRLSFAYLFVFIVQRLFDVESNISDKALTYDFSAWVEFMPSWQVEFSVDLFAKFI